MQAVRHLLPHLSFGVAAVALALLLHAPLLGAPGHIPGEPGSDALRGLWSVWVLGQSWVTWPLGTTAAGFPNGADLLPFPAATLTAAAPLERLVGALSTLRILVIVHTILAVIATGFLVRTLKGSWGVALVAGTLVATQPLMGGALRDGTLEVLAIGWVPLCLGASWRAAQGERLWGLLSGAAFVACCLESAYYASFSALGILLILTTLRTRSGLRQMLLAASTVLVGLAILAAFLWPILSTMDARIGQSGDDAGLQAANAADWGELLQLAGSPGARGWRVADLWAPPWPHWVLLAAGVLLALRRHPWLSVLALLALGFALYLPWLSWWFEGPLGAVVRFPRRYIALLVVAGAAGLAGAGPLLSRSRLHQRYPAIEATLGLILSIWLGYWGAAAGGQLTAYPLLDLSPSPIVERLDQDPERAAVLMLPTELPSAGPQGNTRNQETQIFGGLSESLAGAERLALPVLGDKLSAKAPSLLTLAPRSGPSLHLAKNLSDLCFSHFGMSIPGGAMAPPQAYTEELAWLESHGLKYILVDTSVYEPAALDQLDAVVRPAAEGQEDFGVLRLYVLYSQRPAPAPAPTGQQTGSGLRFQGQVVGGSHLHTDVHVLVTSGSQTKRCPITPETGAFDCGTLDRLDQVQLFAQGVEVPTSREGGYNSARLVVLGTRP
ncbi:MAG: hypothetical protein ACI9VR_001648 [Cognaticolwellia sp.]|jgi:hypothetical protein